MVFRTIPLTAVSLLVFSFLLPTQGLAQAKPIQLSLIGPSLQVVDDDEDIRGVRLNLLYGVNENVTGLDLGLVNHTRGNTKGLQHGLVGVTDGTFTGWQDNIVNLAREGFYGLQSGAVNVMGEGEGFQAGIVFNQAQHLGGLQIALVNIAEDLYGLQIGLINIIRSKDRLPILPIVNWKLDE